MSENTGCSDCWDSAYRSERWGTGLGRTHSPGRCWTQRKEQVFFSRSNAELKGTRPKKAPGGEGNPPVYTGFYSLGDSDPEWVTPPGSYGFQALFKQSRYLTFPSTYSSSQLEKSLLLHGTSYCGSSCHPPVPSYRIPSHCLIASFHHELSFLLTRNQGSFLSGYLFIWVQDKYEVRI